MGGEVRGKYRRICSFDRGPRKRYPGEREAYLLVPKEQTLGPGMASIGQTDDVVGHDVTLLTRKSRFETGKGE